MNDSVKIFAPATVANVGAGFDIFGFALENIGDTITIRHHSEPGIHIIGGRHCETITNDPKLNVAGVAVQAMLDHADYTHAKLSIHIEKNVVPGSGLGSSASSASGAVFGVNELLGLNYTREQLVQFAMIGEGAGGGTPHADNVAPCLLGGFTVIRSYDPLDVFKLPHVANLYVAIIHPRIEVKTSVSKKMLKKEIPMSMAIRQWGNVAGMITGLMSDDYSLIGRSMEDYVAEPVRSMMIPGFDTIRSQALKKGAIGTSISGSGPSIFAFCTSGEKAEELCMLFSNVYMEMDIEHNLYQSKINHSGTTRIDEIH